MKKEVAKLKNNGVNIIIGLGHSGIEVDKTIATEVDGIDMIVGGHSHTFLYTGELENNNLMGIMFVLYLFVCLLVYIILNVV